jgi:transcriptional regulator with XRE-family HTH domain
MTDILSMTSYEAVLRFIELAVAHKGWNQAKFAKEMGMSDAWVSRVMSGDIELSVPLRLPKS